MSLVERSRGRSAPQPWSSAVEEGRLPKENPAWLRPSPNSTMKYPRFWHDLCVLKRRYGILKKLELIKLSGRTIVDVFDDHVERDPQKPCLLFEDESYSYGEVSEKANDLARWISANRRLEKRDVVAVLMNNEPAFAWMWFALARLGLVSSLLNTNLKPFSLIHCIKACEAKALLVGPEFLPVLREIMPDLQKLGISIWLLGDVKQSDAIPMGVVVVNTMATRGLPIPARVRMEQEDTASYIYTSGTTGLPKPAAVSFLRLFFSAELTTLYSPFRPEDVVYTALPLYHSAGLVAGMLSIFLAGGTSAIARRFSAKRFWDDIRKHRATIIQYIGELCRYLLAQPGRPDDGQYSHTIRIAVGNGLRPEIWERFQSRFNIQHIVEFYGTTECSGGFVNTDGKVGAVGRYGWVDKMILDNTELVECDTDTGQPARSASGRCIPVPVGKPGLLLHKLGEFLLFHGYRASKEANEKKIVRNVKVDGDAYFNSGDLLMLDAEGYLYFTDRLGDTYRWKGENVSTLEVSQALCQMPEIQEANVYGVTVPGQEGRAGMAAIVMHDGKPFKPAALYQHVTNNLPNYARPRFVRIMPSMMITATFKHLKRDLAREGFDVQIVKDPMFVLDEQNKTYSVLETATLKQLFVGRSKL